ncbi:hypothetical protein BGX26_002791 [Mortierella sp. AD094]|nr:hypothetical protein BGX26_002791 [Mortierella sp. AD094]
MTACTPTQRPSDGLGLPQFSASSPSIALMDRDISLFNNRHAQRYENAIRLAQEASGHELIEVPSPMSRQGWASTLLPTSPIRAMSPTFATTASVSAATMAEASNSPRVIADVVPTAYTGMFSPMTGGIVGSPSMLRRQLERQLMIDSSIMECLLPGGRRDQTNSPSLIQQDSSVGPRGTPLRQLGQERHQQLDELRLPSPVQNRSEIGSPNAACNDRSDN